MPGIDGLEVLDPSEIDRAVKIFRRDGFVIVRDALDADGCHAGNWYERALAGYR